MNGLGLTTQIYGPYMFSLLWHGYSPDVTASRDIGIGIAANALKRKNDEKETGRHTTHNIKGDGFEEAERVANAMRLQALLA